jgi:hypothetical protein
MDFYCNLRPVGSEVFFMIVSSLPIALIYWLHLPTLAGVIPRHEGSPEVLFLFKSIIY